MRKVLIWCIRFYQKNLSARKGGPTCRFHPSCSEYALEAIPLCKGGFDPVPEKLTFFHKNKKENGT